MAVAAAMMPARAVASDAADVMATVRQFVNGFNTGDMKSAAAACDSPAFVIDDFPPHAWAGATACADWARAYAASVRDAGITGGIVTMGTPLHDDVTGDRAYVVVPTTFAYKLHGKPVVETGAEWTLALKKTAAGWRIEAWAWAKH